MIKFNAQVLFLVISYELSILRIQMLKPAVVRIVIIPRKLDSLDFSKLIESVMVF